MTRKDFNQLPYGLYRVWWKSEAGASLAAVGVTINGERWLACCNWTQPADIPIPSTLLRAIKTVTRVGR